MKKIAFVLAVFAGLAFAPGAALAHVSPPVVLVSEADTLKAMTGLSEAPAVRKVKLDAAQRRACCSRRPTMRGVKPALISLRIRVCGAPSIDTSIRPLISGRGESCGPSSALNSSASRLASWMSSYFDST